MVIGCKQLSKRSRTASRTQVVRSDSGFRKQKDMGGVESQGSPAGVIKGSSDPYSVYND
jgi:hypothetical protein